MWPMLLSPFGRSISMETNSFMDHQQQETLLPLTRHDLLLLAREWARNLSQMDLFWILGGCSSDPSSRAYCASRLDRVAEILGEDEVKCIVREEDDKATEAVKDVVGQWLENGDFSEPVIGNAYVWDLLGWLKHCHDPFPARFCALLSVPEGGSYRDAVEAITRTVDRSLLDLNHALFLRRREPPDLPVPTTDETSAPSLVNPSEASCDEEVLRAIKDGLAIDRSNPERQPTEGHP
jgi:hypothetical protein